MANAGRHNDTRILKSMIKSGKLIKISPDDHAVVVKIKTLFNDIVLSDQPSNYTWNGKKIVTHSAWSRMNENLIKVNQLRVRHWYFKSISL